MLAIPGMCMAAAMTAVLATFLFDYYWNFKEGLLFGAVTAATDPVAVVSLLREVGRRNQICRVSLILISVDLSFACSDQIIFFNWTIGQFTSCRY